jgi:hypothetical protein
VTVFRVDTDGRLRVIFPREPWSDPYIRDDRKTIELPGNRGGRSFIVDDYPGVGYLFAVASPEPFDYDAIARGDYWDYRLIDGGRIQRDPYVVLTDLAERISPDADYDYDVVPYYVERHYDYPRFVCYDCHALRSYDQWNPYSRSCARFDLVIYDDPRYYPYRSGRGRNVVITRPTHPGARFVFRDREPGRDSVTRRRAGVGPTSSADPRVARKAGAVWTSADPDRCRHPRPAAWQTAGGYRRRRSPLRRASSRIGAGPSGPTANRRPGRPRQGAGPGAPAGSLHHHDHPAVTVRPADGPSLRAPASGASPPQALKAGPWVQALAVVAGAAMCAAPARAQGLAEGAAVESIGSADMAPGSASCPTTR